MPDIFVSGPKKKPTKRPSPPVEKRKRDSNKSRFKEVKGKKKHKLPGHTHNPLTSYYYQPDKVKFINKDPEEKVVLLLRKHPFTNVGWMIIAFIMLISPAFISAFSFFGLLPFGYKLILVMCWYLITFAFVLEKFLSWFFHVNIITDERIIEVDFANLIYREMTDANIDEIQEVTVEVGGALRTSLRFGDVFIQTAAEVSRLEFEDVPNPDKVARVLRDLRIEEEIEKLEGRVR